MSEKIKTIWNHLKTGFIEGLNLKINPNDIMKQPNEELTCAVNQIIINDNIMHVNACNCKHELEILKHKYVVLSNEKEELEKRLKKYE